MKRVKAVRQGENPAKQINIPPPLLMAGLVLFSINAQASVTLTPGYGNFGSISILNHAPVILAPPPPTISLGVASASSSASGSMFYQVSTSYGNFIESDSSADGSPVELELKHKGYGYQAEAFSQTGLAQARAETKSPAGGGYGSDGSSSASATSVWSDWFVISGGTGLGTASFASVLDGVMVSAKNGSAGYSLNIGYSTGSYCYSWYNTCGEADLNQSLFSQTSTLFGKGKSALSQEVEGEFTFGYDKAFNLTVTLNANATNGGLADFSLATFENSLVLPEGASLLSASGFAYVQTVPEAGNSAMMLVGLALLGWSAMRRRAISE